MPCAASVTVTDETLGARLRGRADLAAAQPVDERDTRVSGERARGAAVLVKSIGTYVLPAAPLPWLLARFTDSAAVLHLARPGAVEERDVGAAAGVLAPGAVLARAVAELPADDAADDGDAGVLPDDPQPAAAAAATASHVTARPRRALTENVIIPIPFVLAGQVLREPKAHLPGASRAALPRLRCSMYRCILGIFTGRDGTPGARLPVPRPLRRPGLLRGWNPFVPHGPGG